MYKIKENINSLKRVAKFVGISTLAFTTAAAPLAPAVLNAAGQTELSIISTQDLLKALDVATKNLETSRQEEQDIMNKVQSGTLSFNSLTSAQAKVNEAEAKLENAIKDVENNEKIFIKEVNDATANVIKFEQAAQDIMSKINARQLGFGAANDAQNKINEAKLKLDAAKLALEKAEGVLHFQDGAVAMAAQNAAKVEAYEAADKSKALLVLKTLEESKHNLEIARQEEQDIMNKVQSGALSFNSLTSAQSKVTEAEAKLENAIKDVENNEKIFIKEVNDATANVIKFEQAAQDIMSKINARQLGFGAAKDAQNKIDEAKLKLDAAKLALEKAEGVLHFQDGAVAMAAQNAAKEAANKAADKAIADEHLKDGAVAMAAQNAAKEAANKAADKAIADEHLKDGSVAMAAQNAAKVEANKAADKAIADEHLKDGAVAMAAQNAAKEAANKAADKAIADEHLKDGSVAMAAQNAAKVEANKAANKAADKAADKAIEYNTNRVQHESDAANAFDLAVQGSKELAKEFESKQQELTAITTGETRQEVSSSHVVSGTPFTNIVPSAQVVSPSVPTVNVVSPSTNVVSPSVPTVNMVTPSTNVVSPSVPTVNMVTPSAHVVSTNVPTVHVATPSAHVVSSGVPTPHSVNSSKPFYVKVNGKAVFTGKVGQLLGKHHVAHVNHLKAGTVSIVKSGSALKITGLKTDFGYKVSSVKFVTAKDGSVTANVTTSKVGYAVYVKYGKSNKKVVSGTFTYNKNLKRFSNKNHVSGTPKFVFKTSHGKKVLVVKGLKANKHYKITKVSVKYVKGAETAYVSVAKTR